MRIRPAHASFLAAVVLVLIPAAAQAYPQWQFSSGVARCNVCHFSPGGGGLVTGYARDAIGSELSTIEGEGAFLHGVVKLPSRLVLGGDFRGALASQDENELTGSRTAIFPMQADVAGRLTIVNGFSFTAIGGVRGQRRASEGFTPFQNYQPIDDSRFVSREHFFTWQPDPTGYYVRVGRFFAPYGLRMAEHLTYVRRDLGFNTLEESYNVSAGYVTTPWELHVTGFAPDFLRHMGSNESGVTAYYEHRVLEDNAGLAAQGRIAVRDGITRYIGGGVAKLYSPLMRTLFFAEGNFVHWQLDGGLGRNQFVGTGGVTVLPLRGFMVTLLGERNQEDLQVGSAAWTAGTALLNWFPYPHVEVQVMGRLEFPGTTETTKTFLAQIHYFL
jgi:hypothetical protein